MCKTCRLLGFSGFLSNVRSGTLLVTPHIRLKPRPFQHFLVKMRAWWGCVAQRTNKPKTWTPKPVNLKALYYENPKISTLRILPRRHPERKTKRAKELPYLEAHGT